MIVSGITRTAPGCPRARERSGEAVGKQEIPPLVLERGAVGLRVVPLRKEQRPLGPRRAEGNALPVEDPDPRRERIGVVATRGEKAPEIPVHSLFGPADRQNRAAVLPRNRESARARVCGLEPVEERGPAKPGGGSTGAVDADQRSGLILHADGVADDAGVRGPAP